MRRTQNRINVPLSLKCAWCLLFPPASPSHTSAASVVSPGHPPCRGQIIMPSTGSFTPGAGACTATFTCYGFYFLIIIICFFYWARIMLKAVHVTTKSALPSLKFPKLQLQFQQDSSRKRVEYQKQQSSPTLRTPVSHATADRGTKLLQRKTWLIWRAMRKQPAASVFVLVERCVTAFTRLAFLLLLMTVGLLAHTLCLASTSQPTCWQTR